MIRLLKEMSDDPEWRLSCVEYATEIVADEKGLTINVMDTLCVR